MYGLVNLGVKELVVSKFGEDKWLRIKEIVGMKDDSFVRMKSYDDKMTYDMVAASSEVLNLKPDDVLKAFGEYWVMFTGQEGYADLFKAGGETLKEFLLNLDNLHSRIGQNFTHLIPPSFQYSNVGTNSMIMHYHSERKGLCPMVIGLLNGLAKYFKTNLEIEEITCSRKGDPHCKFSLEF